jgi:hypothetical protein
MHPVHTAHDVRAELGQGAQKEAVEERQGRQSDAMSIDASDIEMMAETTGSNCLSSTAHQGLSPDLVKQGIQALERRLSEGLPRPTLFAVVQTIGMTCHKNIIAQQETAAAEILDDPEWGPKIKAIKHAEVKDGMRQQLALARADALKSLCTVEGFDTWVDQDTIPSLLCGIATGVRGQFQEALLGVVASAKAENPNFGWRPDSDKAIELKVGPVKRAERICVKVQDYAEEKGVEEYPHSQFVTDVLRASIIVDTAEDMVRTWESLKASSDFKVVRLKNKIGKCEAPFNLHANMTYSPAGCLDPITCELHFYPRGVYDLQHIQHLMYEVSRAPSVEQFF